MFAYSDGPKMVLASCMQLCDASVALIRADSDVQLAMRLVPYSTCSPS